MPSAPAPPPVGPAFPLPPEPAAVGEPAPVGAAPAVPPAGVLLGLSSLEHAARRRPTASVEIEVKRCCARCAFFSMAWRCARGTRREPRPHRQRLSHTAIGYPGEAGRHELPTPHPCSARARPSRAGRIFRRACARWPRPDVVLGAAPARAMGGEPTAKPELHRRGAVRLRVVPVYIEDRHVGIRRVAVASPYAAAPRSR